MSFSFFSASIRLDTLISVFIFKFIRFNTYLKSCYIDSFKVGLNIMLIWLARKKGWFFGQLLWSWFSYFISALSLNCIAVKLWVFYFCKYLVFRLKAYYILAQWQRPERTTPWVKFDGYELKLWVVHSELLQSSLHLFINNKIHDTVLYLRHSNGYSYFLIHRITFRLHFG